MVPKLGLNKVLGSKSGREWDKISEVGFYLVDVDVQPAFEESTYVLVCRKIYQLDMPLSTSPEDDAKQYYAAGDSHTMYVSEILACYKNV